MVENIKGLNMVLLGKMGVGKSASGNTILGQEAFESRESFTSVTNNLSVQSGIICEIPVTVYDTPGLLNKELSEGEIKQIYEEVLLKCECDPCVFLLVIKADRFTADDTETVKTIETILGEKRLEKTWILFTGGDELEEENIPIQEFIKDNKKLKRLVQKYDQRYHVFNNRTREASDQVKVLFTKILLNPQMRKIPKKDPPVSGLSSRRIVLLGKTGAGKSAAGNTILGRREFRSVMSMNSVTGVCSEARATVSGRSVSVVDTPGFFNTHKDTKELMTEVARSVQISNPGPHAFLIVFPLNVRFTEQERQIPQIIKMMFGQDVLKYSIILFTHGDLLYEQYAEEIIEEISGLRDLVDQCGGRNHIFNNENMRNRDQVKDLLEKIDSMIEQNDRGHYSNEMFEDAQSLRREEEVKKRIEEEIEKVREEGESRTLLTKGGAVVGAIAVFIAGSIGVGIYFGIVEALLYYRYLTYRIAIVSGAVVSLAVAAAVGALGGVITARVQNTRRRRRSNRQEITRA